VILGHAGGPTAIDGVINVGTTLLGDGLMTAGEVTFPTTPGAVFAPCVVPGTAPICLTVTQGAAVATADFINGMVGGMQAAEITAMTAPFTAPNADISTGITITITGGGGVATALFTDANGDMAIVPTELSAFVTTAAFPSPAPTAITLAGPTGIAHAFATFTDSTTILEPGELVLTGSTGGFVTGPCTITDVFGGIGTALAATCTDAPAVRQFGPILEIAPDAGIFEIDLTITYTDGPASTICPTTLVFGSLDGTLATGEANRFSTPAPADQNYCILQGDILQVEYTDPADASGDPNNFTDYYSFDI
jgi:hypothetical protein